MPYSRRTGQGSAVAKSGDVRAMSEAELSKAVLGLASMCGWRVARFPAANWTRTRSGREFVRPLAYDTKGFPDALLVRERMIAVEFKTAVGSLSIEQDQWLDLLGMANVECYLWRPAQWIDGTIERVLA